MVVKLVSYARCHEQMGKYKKQHICFYRGRWVGAASNLNGCVGHSPDDVKRLDEWLSDRSKKVAITTC